MKIIKSLTIAMCFFTGFNLKAQDVIVKTNKEKFKAKVLYVEGSVIKYKKFDFQDGPTYSINKSEVFMIIYKNGKRETFETAAPTKPQQKMVWKKYLPVILLLLIKTFRFTKAQNSFKLGLVLVEATM